MDERTTTDSLRPPASSVARVATAVALLAAAFAMNCSRDSQRVSLTHRELAHSFEPQTIQSAPLASAAAEPQARGEADSAIAEEPEQMAAAAILAATTDIEAMRALVPPEGVRLCERLLNPNANQPSDPPQCTTFPPAGMTGATTVDKIRHFTGRPDGDAFERFRPAVCQVEPEHKIVCRAEDSNLPGARIWKFKLEANRHLRLVQVFHEWVGIH